MNRSASANRVAEMWVMAESGAGADFMAKYYMEFALKFPSSPSGKDIPPAIAKALKDLGKTCESYLSAGIKEVPKTPSKKPEVNPKEDEDDQIRSQAEKFAGKKKASPEEDKQTFEWPADKKPEEPKAEESDKTPEDEKAPEEPADFKVDMTGALSAASKEAAGAHLGDMDLHKPSKLTTDGQLEAYIVCRAFTKARMTVPWPDPDDKINSMWRKFIAAVESRVPELSPGEEIVARIDKAAKALQTIKTPMSKTQKEQYQKTYQEEKVKEKTDKAEKEKADQAEKDKTEKEKADEKEKAEKGKAVTPEIDEWWKTAQRDLWFVWRTVQKSLPLKDDQGVPLTDAYFKAIDKTRLSRPFRKGTTYESSFNVFSAMFKKDHLPSDWKDRLKEMMDSVGDLDKRLEKKLKEAPKKDEPKAPATLKSKSEELQKSTGKEPAKEKPAKAKPTGEKWKGTQETVEKKQTPRRKRVPTEVAVKRAKRIASKFLNRGQSTDSMSY